MELIFNGVNGTGVLDYVTAWYIKLPNIFRNTILKKTTITLTLA